MLLSLNLTYLESFPCLSTLRWDGRWKPGDRHREFQNGCYQPPVLKHNFIDNFILQHAETKFERLLHDWNTTTNQMVVSPIMSYGRHIGFQDGAISPPSNTFSLITFVLQQIETKFKWLHLGFWVWPIKWCHWRLCHMAAILDFKMATIVDAPYT